MLTLVMVLGISGIIVYEWWWEGVDEEQRGSAPSPHVTNVLRSDMKSLVR